MVKTFNRVVLALTLLLACHMASAKLIAMTLEELVESSTLIAYGRSVPAHASALVVSFQPIAILKGEHRKGDALPICNEIDDVESYNLNLISEPYVLFAKENGQCFMPIRGLISIVRVKGGDALTASIAAEPRVQPVKDLLKRIEGLAATK